MTEAYIIEVAIPNSHNLHSTITKNFHKYADLKEKLLRIWWLKMAYITALVLSIMGIVLNKLHKSLKTT
jgi:hypothetical protein